MSEQRLIRIISDGSYKGSDIIDVASGQTLRNVQHIDVHIDGGIDPPSATMTVIAPSLDLTLWTTIEQAGWLVALYTQIKEMRALLEEFVSEWGEPPGQGVGANAELELVVKARALLEKYPADKEASDGE